ncbi:uncharacterized protein LOC34618782 [Cyclospora cayetanensis]|uniref:Uncharacterized protein LOC34618782 n=1 Tax=Cyclospora cayetanensis TaxID=88456 RepID=A0A6P6S078_9EIME|nr:uncharacterized protein LOC34618782 [Cyclospora cayetanensis]
MDPESLLDMALDDQLRKQGTLEQIHHTDHQHNSHKGGSCRSQKTGPLVSRSPRPNAHCSCCCCSQARCSTCRVACKHSLSLEDLSSKVLLNVGGRHFATTASTLSNYGPHYLSRRLSPPWRHGETREIFVDRNGDAFTYILDFLRNGTLCCSNKPWLLQQLLLEARFFCIRPLEEEIERRIKTVMAESIASRCAEAERQVRVSIVTVGYTPAVSRSILCAAALSDCSIPCSAVPARHSYTSPRYAAVAADVSIALLNAVVYSMCGKNSQVYPCACNASESLMMPQSTAVATTAVDAPPEQVKLVPTATAAELAARAEFLRRSLINDDPEPPEQTAVQDLGERVLYTDEEF